MSFSFSGCPKKLLAGKIQCDPLLLVEIEDLRTSSKQTGTSQIIEDFTEPNEEDNSQ